MISRSDPYGKTRELNNARQADNAPVSKKQARNPARTERAFRQEIPITFAESLCSRVATREDAEVRLGQETALGVSDLCPFRGADYAYNVLCLEYVVVGETHAVSSIDPVQHSFADFRMDFQRQFLESCLVRNQIRVWQNVPCVIAELLRVLNRVHHYHIQEI